jgi:hypothetical protein
MRSTQTRSEELICCLGVAPKRAQQNTGVVVRSDANAAAVKRVSH